MHTGSNFYHKFTTALQSSWDVEDEGPVSDLLNFEIERTSNCISLRQTSYMYIERMTEAHFPDGVPNTIRIQANSTPCLPGIEGLVLEAMERVDAPCPKLLRSYQSIVDGLLYCSTNTHGQTIAFFLSRDALPRDVSPHS